MTELNQMPACSKPLLPLVVGGLTITCEDNMELMSRYPDNYFDLAIACHDYKYELTACELDKEYYDKAIQRINNHTNQQKLF